MQRMGRRRTVQLCSTESRTREVQKSKRKQWRGGAPIENYIAYIDYDFNCLKLQNYGVSGSLFNRLLTPKFQSVQGKNKHLIIKWFLVENCGEKNSDCCCSLIIIVLAHILC